MQATRDKLDLRSLTGLRCVAMFPVFLAHAALEGVFDNDDLNWAYLDTLLPPALSAVSFFFILTGFVMTLSTRPTDTARRFWRRRFFRIAPSHFVAYLFALVLMLSAGMTVGGPSAVAQLFLLQGWVPDPQYFDTGNSVTWSLSADLFFYLMFPFLLILVNKIKENRLWYWLIAPAALLVLIPVFATLFLGEGEVMPLGGVSLNQYWLVYFAPFTRMMECVIGMLIARLVMSGRWVRFRVLPATLLVIVVGVISPQLPYLFRISVVMLVPLALLLGAVATADIEGRGTPLNKRFIVWLGEVSFCFYLVHNLILKYGHMAFGGPIVDGEMELRTWSTAGGIGILALAFLLSVGLAWLMHRFVEKPIVRRWSKPRPKPARQEVEPPREAPSPGEAAVPGEAPSPGEAAEIGRPGDPTIAGADTTAVKDR